MGGGGGTTCQAQGRSAGCGLHPGSCPKASMGSGVHCLARWGTGGEPPGAVSERATTRRTLCPDSEAKCAPEIWGHSTLLFEMSKPVTKKPHVFPEFLQHCVD